MMTVADQKSAPSFGYPRPQLQREQWTDLNGAWEFAVDADARWDGPDDVTFDRTIQVPYAPETPASGIEQKGYFLAVWYRREVVAPALVDGQRLLLHFGAVDDQATVWVNGREMARHEGGYAPFVVDVTDAAHGKEKLSIVVRAWDDPHDLSKPRGKQDWMAEPHSIWYPRTTGIWQSVWMEIVPAIRIETIRWEADVRRWEMGVELSLVGRRGDESRGGESRGAELPGAMSVRVRLALPGRVLADDVYEVPADRLRGPVVKQSLRRRIALTMPGGDDLGNHLLWSPHSPRLIDAEITLMDATGRVIDRVGSYTAMRSVGIEAGHLLLNGLPFVPMMLLDQGYWPESGLTAPDDAAYRRDVELVKAMGFNGVRKHQKIENPRFLYWADKLGLVVWEEMPSAYQFSVTAARRTMDQWARVIERDISHPCIIAWVPFNESWGVPDLSSSARQREFVLGVYHQTRALDPSRPVISNDGWELPTTDIVGVHDYERDPGALRRRYSGDKPVQEILKAVRPAGRALLLPGFDYAGQPFMLTEFGGIALHADATNTWGYTRVSSGEELAGRYAFLLASVRGTASFRGFCYTQFTDTYQEANGLLYMDRTPKFPIEQIAIATRGPRNPQEMEIQRKWIESAQRRMDEHQGASFESILP